MSAVNSMFNWLPSTTPPLWSSWAASPPAPNLSPAATTEGSGVRGERGRVQIGGGREGSGERGGKWRRNRKLACKVLQDLAVRNDINLRL